MVTERKAMIEWDNPELPITVQANMLGINRTGLYYKHVQPSAEEIAIKHRIDEIYTAHPFYGSRRITAQLNREGVRINRKAVQRHMREMGIAGICPGPNLSKRQLKEQVYPYLLRNVVASYPNHVWGIDVTYIRLTNGWMYLVAVIDWYSRYVISWAMDQTLEIEFVIQAVKQALDQSIPEIFNSDQGSHFTSPRYIQLVLGAGARISMDGKGRARDNIFTERLWRSLKYEEVYLNEYKSPRQARCKIKEYFEFYNHKRLHQSLEYRTPAEVYGSKEVRRS